MKRSIYFPDQLYEQLEKLAEKKNISVASLVRLIITDYIEMENNKQQEE